MKSPSAALLLSLSVLTGSAWAGDTDWPHFRGPDQNGASRPGLLTSETFGLEIDWKRPLGKGYSAISIVAEQGVTLFTDGETDYVVSFALASGDELWRFPLAEMYRGHDGSDDGPISTPTIHDGVVYALGPRGQLVALRLESGEEIWKVDLDKATGAREPVYGYSTTPVVVGERVIVLTGGSDGHSITAYEAQSGELVWHAGDDRVGYQSPLVAEVDGKQLLIAATDHELTGLDPSDGKTLWRHRHSESDEEGFGQPVLLPGGRILLPSWEEATLFQISGGEEGWAVEELWRSRSLRGSYALPVYHEGYLYGFTSHFLSCIDPATGEPVWRSRPPGGQGLILVDGRLVLTSSEGDLVVATANPEAYRELARLPLFESESITAPSIAGRYIYARDASDLARVRISESRTTQMTAPPQREMEIPDGEFGDFVRRVKAADQAQKSALIDEFMARQESFPVIEGEGQVHFVYLGEVEDVELHGTMLTDVDAAALYRIEGTDFYFYSMELDPEGQWEYRYGVDFGEQGPDPRNPLDIGSLNGPSSELRMPRWPVPTHLSEPRGPRGRIDAFTYQSPSLENEREVQVYLPPGYDLEEDRDKRYPLVLYNNGDSALENALIDRSLDNLIGKTVEPVIVALLPRVGAEFGGDTADGYVRMLTEELIPHLDRTYRTRVEPSSRAIMGVGSGAYISAYATFTAPGTFGKLATQSLYVNPATGDAFVAAIEGGEPQELEIYVEWSRHDYDVPEAGIDAAKSSAELADRLTARGYQVRRSLVTGAAGWGSWRATIDQILEGFYPSR